MLKPDMWNSFIMVWFMLGHNITVLPSCKVMCQNLRISHHVCNISQDLLLKSFYKTLGLARIGVSLSQVTLNYVN